MQRTTSANGRINASTILELAGDSSVILPEDEDGLDVRSLDSLLETNELEISKCINRIVALAGQIPGCGEYDTADEAVTVITRKHLLEKNACYDFEPESIAHFLRHLIKTLEKNKGQEETLFQLLLDFSSREGFVFPFRSTKSDPSLGTSVLSLNTVVDEGEQINRALWEEVKTCLETYFSNCLCQLSITDCSLIANETRLDYLQKLSVLLDDKDIWDHYRALRSYQLNSFLNDALQTANDTSEAKIKMVAPKFSLICRTAVSMIDVDFFIFSSGILQAVLSPFEAINCIYLEKLYDIMESVLENTSGEILPEEKHSSAAASPRMGKRGSEHSVADALRFSSIGRAQAKNLTSVLPVQRDGAATAATSLEREESASIIEGVFYPLRTMVIDMAAIEHHLDVLSASSVLCSPLSQAATITAASGKEKKKGVLKSASSSDMSESSEMVQSTLNGGDIPNLPLDSWHTERAPEVVERPPFHDKPKWLWRDALKKYVPFLCKMVEVLIDKAAEQCRQRLLDLPNSSALSGVIVEVCPTLFGNRLEYPRVVLKPVADLLVTLDDLLPLAKAAGSRVLTPLMSCFVSATTIHLREVHAALTKLLESIPEKREFKWILYVIATAAVIRNHMYHYDTVLGDEKDSKNNFLLIYRQYCEMVDLASQQFTDMENTMMATSLLHDAESNNWADSKEFFEDEWCSFPIQMWNLHMQAIQHDLWSVCPPKISQAIFGNALQYSLEVLTRRYCSVSPSYRRVKQFRMDITTILLCTYEFLFPAATTPSSIFDIPSSAAINGLQQVHYAIHSACSRLLAALAIVASPLDSLYAVFKHGYHRRAKKKHKSSRSGSNAGVSSGNGAAATVPSPGDPCQWLSWIHGELHSRGEKSYEMMQTTTALHLHIKIVREQPEPSWALILQSLLMKDYTLAVLLLTNDPQRQEQQALPQRGLPVDCSATGAALCPGQESCTVTRASSHMTTMFRPVLHIINRCSPYYANGLARALLPVIERSNAWGLFDVKTFLDNVDKVSWLRIVMELMEPYAEAVLLDTLTSLAASSSLRKSASGASEGGSGAEISIESLLEELPCGCPLSGSLLLHASNDEAEDPLLVLIDSIASHVQRLSVSLDVLFCSLQEELEQRSVRLAHGSVHVQMVALCLITKLRDVGFIEKTIRGALPAYMRQELTDLADCLVFTLLGAIHDSTAEAINVYMKLADNSCVQKHVAITVRCLQNSPWHLCEEDVDNGEACQDFVGYKMIILANSVLHTEDGEMYLRQMHNILLHNHNWLDMCLGIVSPLPQRHPLPPQLSATAEARKWHPFNPLERFEQIGSAVFSQETIAEFTFDWQKLLHSDLGLTEVNVRTLMSHRHEFQDGAHLEEKEKKPVEVLRSKFDKDPNEIK